MFKPNSLTLILLTGGLMAAGPLATDMYLPSLPSLTAVFATSVSMVTLTLTVYLAGYAVGQLTVGPFSDRFGRRPGLVIGMSLFAAASLACVFAPNIESLIAARFFQALGACSGQVVGRAAIRDLHDRAGVTRMFAYTMVIMGLSSMVSPLIGGYLSVWIGWRSIFVVLAIFGLIMAITVQRNFDESLAKANPLATRTGPMVRNFARLLRTRTFAGYTLSLCLIFSTLFTYLAGSSFVFIDVFGMAPQEFGLVFPAMAGTSVIGSLLTGRLAKRFEIPAMYGVAAAGAAAGGLALVIVTLAGGGIVPHVVALSVVSFFLGILIPVGYAGALAPHPEMAGTATSLIGVLQSSFAMVAGYVVGVLFDGTPLPMSAMMAVLATLSLLSFLFVVQPFRSRVAEGPGHAPGPASPPAE